jgi:hypothetical protein
MNTPMLLLASGLGGLLALQIACSSNTLLIGRHVVPVTSSGGTLTVVGSSTTADLSVWAESENPRIHDDFDRIWLRFQIPAEVRTRENVFLDDIRILFLVRATGRHQCLIVGPTANSQLKLRRTKEGFDGEIDAKIVGTAPCMPDAARLNFTFTATSS